MSRNDNTWADWLARVARHVKRDVGLEEFAEVWPTDQPAPKEVGACVWKADALVVGAELEGELGEALAALPCSQRHPALAAWVAAKTRGLRVEPLYCPRCEAVYIDTGQ